MKTRIATTTADAITVRGHDLAAELMGTVGYTDMFLLTTLGRVPTAGERRLVDTIAVSVMDHGITPSSLTARLTLLGAPESFQAAVAAGLSGAGSTFLGGMTEVTRMLRAALPEPTGGETVAQLGVVADSVVARRTREGLRIPGIGHNIHSESDPRVSRLRQVAAEEGYFDTHWRLMEQLPAAVERTTGRRLPVNNVGAIGATVAALGFPEEMGRGIALAARAGGLVAHLLEELSDPLGKDVWHLLLEHIERA